MVHGLRMLQHWNQWLSQQFLGVDLLATEKKVMSEILSQHFGKHAVLVGVPSQYDLLNATPIPCHSLLSPLNHKKMDFNYVESNLHELPILTGSIDLVLMPHILEFIDNPRQLLSEACRIIKPEGLIVICGFNPYSLWGIRKKIDKHKEVPWSGNFIQMREVKQWLHLADFQMEKQTSALFKPPLKHQGFYDKLHFLEKMGLVCLPQTGGVYILSARAKVIPLTPIRMKWKQHLGSIRISTSISGHIARRSQ